MKKIKNNIDEADILCNMCNESCIVNGDYKYSQLVYNWNVYNKDELHFCEKCSENIEDYINSYKLYFIDTTHSE